MAEILKDCAVPPDEDGFTSYGGIFVLHSSALIINGIVVIIIWLIFPEFLNKLMAGPNLKVEN